MGSLILKEPFFGNKFVSVDLITILPVVFTWVGLNVTLHDENEAGCRAIDVELAEISLPILTLKLPVDIAGLGFKTPLSYIVAVDMAVSMGTAPDTLATYAPADPVITTGKGPLTIASLIIMRSQVTGPPDDAIAK